MEKAFFIRVIDISDARSTVYKHEGSVVVKRLKTWNRIGVIAVKTGGYGLIQRGTPIQFHQRTEMVEFF